MLRALGYCRLSDEDINRPSASLDNQEKEIKLFCARINLSLIKTFNEGIEKGTDWKRTEINKILALAEEHAFDVLVVRDISRIARDQEYGIKILTHLRNLNVKVMDITGEDLSKNLVYTGIKLAIATEPIEKGKEYQRQMMKNKKQEGLPFGLPPFGYKVQRTIIDQKLIRAWVPDVEMAPAINALFNLYAETDKTIVECIYEINKTFNKNITKSGAFSILGNKKYIGIFVYKKRVKEQGSVIKTYKGEYKLNNWQNLTTKEIFNKVQKKMTRKGHTDREKLRDNLLEPDPDND